jgi:membrane protease subunit HflC
MPAKAKPFAALLPTLLFVGVMAVLSSCYIVTEGHRALVLRLGKLMKDSQSQVIEQAPGLHFKLPFIDHVRSLDIRLRSFDVQSSRILTVKQKYVLVDYYVKWRIEDLADFYKKTDARAAKAEHLMQQKINDVLRAAFGRKTITDVVSGDRLNIMNLLKSHANTAAERLGIDVVDVRIKRIDLPEEVSQSVYQRMQTQREQVAAKHRSAGKAQGELIRAQADAKAAVIVAEADRKGAEIKAEGLQQAAKIYNDAALKSPDFFDFLRSMDTYHKIFKPGQDILLLSKDTKLFSKI